MAEKINSYRDLRVYQNAMEAGMKIFELTKGFPPEEKYALTDQIRRSSRFVCSSIARAWRKRNYKPGFLAKLADAEGEACEILVLIELAAKCQYLGDDARTALESAYDLILGQLVKMIIENDKWLIGNRPSVSPGPNG
jgi:four helix bundle protein